MNLTAGIEKIKTLIRVDAQVRDIEDDRSEFDRSKHFYENLKEIFVLPWPWFCNFDRN